MSEFFDPADPTFIADPYPTLNALRESGPVHRDGEWDLWLITRHADVKAAQLDRRLGSVQHGHARPDEFRPIRELDLEGWEVYYATERHSLLMLEPPEHARLRTLVSHAFTPRRVRDLREPITEIADELLSGLGDRTSFDLLADFAQPYSIRVIARLLGAPVDDAHLLLDWSHAIVKMYELTTTLAQANEAIDASRRFTEWTLSLIASRRTTPRDDLITALCDAETEDGMLSDAEIVSTVMLLLNAGHEATVNTLGNGLTAMLERSADWASLVEGTVTPKTAIEEMLRFDSPLQMFERYTLTDDIVIAGTPIPKGEKIAMLFGSANRDPREYEAPDEFRVDRNQAGHVTFGAGVHYCLGAPLARLELDVAVTQLVKSFPDLAPASIPVREDGFVIRGFESVELAI